MEKTKIISLLIAAIYIIAFIYVFSVDEEHNARRPEEESLSENIAGVIIFLMISLACIWWGDELGEVIGGRYRLISSTSPGWAVKLMGWALLLLPAFLIGLKWIRGN